MEQLQNTEQTVPLSDYHEVLNLIYDTMETCLNIFRVTVNVITDPKNYEQPEE